MKNNIKNKDQCNDAIGYDPNFDNKFSLSSVTNEPLTIVTVSLRGGKNHRATIIAGLTCLWDSRSTYRRIKSQHTKPYEHRMLSNNVEYSTDAGLYCTTHDVKVPFCMSECSISKIILRRFHIDENKYES